MRQQQQNLQPNDTITVSSQRESYQSWQLENEPMAQQPLFLQQGFGESPDNEEKPPSNPTAPAPESAPSIVLHRACQLFPKSKEVIEIAVSTESAAVSSSIQIDVENSSRDQNKTINRRERYSYAINIAIFHKSIEAVVELLANAAPNVLVLPDGRDGHTTLGIILQGSGFSSCLSFIDVVLQTNPACAYSAVDRRQNYPLHIACSMGAPLQVIQRLHRAYPGSTSTRNIAGETPLMIAQRFCACPEEVLEYLQSQMWR